MLHHARLNVPLDCEKRVTILIASKARETDSSKALCFVLCLHLQAHSLPLTSLSVSGQIIPKAMCAELYSSQARAQSLALESSFVCTLIRLDAFCAEHYLSEHYLCFPPDSNHMPRHGIDILERGVLSVVLHTTITTGQKQATPTRGQRGRSG